MVIQDDNFNLDNIKIIGNYIITFRLTINNMTTTTPYNYSVCPQINYPEEIFYSIYNTEFISPKPNAIYEGGIYYLKDNNFIINDVSGIISGPINLDVGEYNLEIHLIYLSFDILKNIKIIIKPNLKIDEQKIIYFECKSLNIIYLPLNGVFDVYNKEYNDLSFISEINKLNVGQYNIEIGYTINNIRSSINLPIIIEKKDLILDIYIEDKEYDNTNTIIIICKNYPEILINGYYENINAGKNKIIIKDIILPDNLIDNYYVDINNYIGTNSLYGNILPQIIYPKITIFDKYFDNTNIANVYFDINIKDYSSDLLVSMNVESYEAIYNSKDIGEHEILIKNIKLGQENYILSQQEYLFIANILPKEITIHYSVKDKIYDETNICIIDTIEKIEGLTITGVNGIECVISTLEIWREAEYFTIVSAIFDDLNVGLHNITILDYKVNSNNYKINFINLKANILPKKINLKIITEDKIYDGTTTSSLKFIDNYEIISYNGNYIDKNIGTKKKIYVDNIILKDTNYYSDNVILFGDILPKMLDFIYYPNSKIYDGTQICDGTYKINKCNDDDIICKFTAEYTNINTSNEIEILIKNIILLGNDSNNYKLNSVKSMNGIIDKKPITCSFKNVDKMYDKSTLGFVKIDKIYGLILNDKFDNIQIISLDAQYEDFFIGNNKKIIIKNIILESKLYNYFIKDTYCIGNIILRELNIVFNSPTKIFDGNNNIKISINNIKNILEEDSIHIKSLKSIFDDKHVGNNKIVYISNIQLDEYSSKYYYCKDIKIEGIIKPKPLTINFIASDQEYEPNIKPILKYNLDDESLKVLSYNALYDNVNIGLQKILIKDIILDGENKNNYIILEQEIFGNILPKNKELEFLATDKFYDTIKKANVVCITDDSILFDANYEIIDVGLQKILINNIIQTKTSYLLKDEYIIYGNILPKELIISPNIIKIYNDNTDYNLTDILEIKSCECKFSSPNVGINIPIIIYNIITTNSNYYIKDFNTIGVIKPSEILCEFIASDKIYDETNKVIFDKIYCKYMILSFDSYYENVNVGYNNIKIENIKLDNKNYICCDLIIKSTIKPKLLEIEFIINSKIYDKINTGVIKSYKLLNSNEKIKLYSYSAEYENINVGKQKVIINNLLIDSQNYYTETYYTYGIIEPRNIIFNFINTTKEYDKTIETYIKLNFFENKILDDDLELIYFNSEYEIYNVSDDINIYVSNIYVQGKSINNYIYNKKIIIKGKIEPKKIDCQFNLINNNIVGKLLNIINNDTLWIENYISYKKNNKYYIENIILDGFDKHNYILINKIYIVI